MTAAKPKPVWPSKARDPEFQWRQMADGSWEIPEAPKKFLEWLLTFPRNPATQAAYAAENGVDVRTLRRWKSDPRFRKEWEAAAHDLNISPERVQSVIDNLYTIASTNGGPAGVKAADLFLQMVDKYTPRKQIVIEDATISSLSNDDLIAMANFG